LIKEVLNKQFVIFYSNHSSNRSPAVVEGFLAIDHKLRCPYQLVIFLSGGFFAYKTFVEHDFNLHIAKLLSTWVPEERREERQEERQEEHQEHNPEQNA